MATKFGRTATYLDFFFLIKPYDPYDHVALQDHMTN